MSLSPLCLSLRLQLISALVAHGLLTPFDTNITGGVLCNDRRQTTKILHCLV
jgi:hypothetical protein